MTNQKSNYEIQTQKALILFPKWNHEKIAKKFNLDLDEHYLYINFIGQKYRLNRQNGSIQYLSKNNTYINATYNEVMSILDLFDYSKEHLHLSGNWCTPNSLKGVVNVGNVGGKNTMFKKYETLFSNNINLLSKACEKLGGQKINEADVGYIINIFDFLPVKFLFFEEDCDFPPEIKFLWDENVLDYIRFETTFFAFSHLLHRIVEVIEGEI